MGHTTTKAVIVETANGKLKGYTSGDVNIFLGIKYANAKRWQMPEPVKPWTGIKNAFGYGYGSPTGLHLPGDETMMPLRFWPENENCQYLNIWTKSVAHSAKKPVMVWFHGGGYALGSAMEHMYYEGLSLCNGNDVVVVSLNHRLNILGYLDLSPFGKKYENSANAGNADIVAALQWIHDNIASFGGDPGNVTIFGQSGGGSKVRDIMQIPAADGLYHRAIVQSGVFDVFSDDDKSHNGREIVTAMMADLGISDVAELETVPFEKLNASYEKVSPAIREKGGYVGGIPLANSWYLGCCSRVGFNPYSLTVPVLAGTTFAEFSYTLAPENKYEMTHEEQIAYLKKHYGDKAETVATLFQKAHPNKNLCDAAAADEFIRIPTLKYASLLAKNHVPVYLYMYCYETNMEHTAAWHLAEIPFVFRNVHMVPRLMEKGVSDVLEDKMANAWCTFAATGCPQTDALPQWKSSTENADYTMIFDREIRISQNFDREFQDFMGKNFPQGIVTVAVGNSHEDAE